MAKFTVRYQVMFECEIEVNGIGNLSDIISNIDIPEGGRSNSAYVPGSIGLYEIRGNGQCFIATEEAVPPILMAVESNPVSA